MLAKKKNAAILAKKIQNAIDKYKKNGGKNNHAFSLGLEYFISLEHDAILEVSVNFAEDSKKIIMLRHGDDQSIVTGLYDGEQKYIYQMIDVLFSDDLIKGIIYTGLKKYDSYSMEIK